MSENFFAKKYGLQKPQEQENFFAKKYGLQLPSQNEEHPQDKGFLGHAQDTGVSALKGIVSVPETVVGLADIPTGGRVGKFLEETTPIQFKQAKDAIGEWHTDQYKEQQRKFDQAGSDTDSMMDKVIAKGKVALSNPALIANTVVESLPSMFAGGAIGRGLGMANKAISPIAGGAIGEGMVMAGQQAENIRYQTEDKQLTPEQSGLSVATGALGALFGYAGGQLARKMGFDDIETAMAAGRLNSQHVGSAIQRMSPLSIPRSIIAGAFTEGFLEELPQSVSEQILQNIALNKEWHEGVDHAIVMGTLAGMAMGGGMNTFTAPMNYYQNNKAYDAQQQALAQEEQAEAARIATAKQQQIAQERQAMLDQQQKLFGDGTNTPNAIFNPYDIYDKTGIPPTAVLDEDVLSHYLQDPKYNYDNGIDFEKPQLSDVWTLGDAPQNYDNTIEYERPTTLQEQQSTPIAGLLNPPDTAIQASMNGQAATPEQRLAMQQAMNNKRLRGETWTDITPIPSQQPIDPNAGTLTQAANIAGLLNPPDTAIQASMNGQAATPEQRLAMQQAMNNKRLRGETWTDITPIPSQQPIDPNAGTLTQAANIAGLLNPPDTAIQASMNGQAATPEQRLAMQQAMNNKRLRGETWTDITPIPSQQPIDPNAGTLTQTANIAGLLNPPDTAIQASMNGQAATPEQRLAMQQAMNNKRLRGETWTDITPIPSQQPIDPTQNMSIKPQNIDTTPKRVDHPPQNRHNNAPQNIDIDSVWDDMPQAQRKEVIKAAGINNKQGKELLGRSSQELGLMGLDQTTQNNLIQAIQANEIQKVKNSQSVLGVSVGDVINTPSFKTIGGQEIAAQSYTVVSRNGDEITVADQNGKRYPLNTTALHKKYGNIITVQKKVQPTEQDLFSAPQTNPTTPKTIKPTGKESVVETANGRQVKTQFAIVDANDLNISHDLFGNQNPNYPQGLQPRDRERFDSQHQVQRIANNLNPERLGTSYTPNEGSPIIGQDMAVESGNGRSLAIKKAYTENKADGYKAYLLANAQQFGLSPEQINNIANPVLVRVRTEDNIDRNAFAAEANAPTALSQTDTETAKVDATRIDHKLLNTLNLDTDGKINFDFLTKFYNTLSPTEQAKYTTKDGQITQSLNKRVRDALFYKAYGDARLLEIIADNSEIEHKNILNALITASPKFVAAQTANSNNTAQYQELNKNIVDAVEVIQQAKAHGQTVGEYVNQLGFFGNTSDSTAKIALALSNYTNSTGKLSTFLGSMADAISQQAKNANGLKLNDGTTAPQNIDDIIAHGITAVTQQYGTGKEQTDMFADIVSNNVTQPKPTNNNGNKDDDLDNDTHQSNTPKQPIKPNGGLDGEQNPSSPDIDQQIAELESQISKTTHNQSNQTKVKLRKQIAALKAQKAKQQQDKNNNPSDLDSNMSDLDSNMSDLDSNMSDPQAKTDPFANNKIFTPDAVAKARKGLKKKLGQLNSGIDPEVLIDGMTIAGAYIESGIRKFSDYAKAMVNDFGEDIKPYLLSFWEAARHYPNLDTKGMTSAEQSKQEFDALNQSAKLSNEMQKVVGEQVSRPKNNTKPKVDHSNRQLVQDWGVPFIDGWTKNAEHQGKEYTDYGYTDGVKAAFLKDTKQYLESVQKQLEQLGYRLHADKKGKPERINVNQEGQGNSGSVTLLMTHDNGTNIYVTIGESTFVSSHPQHIGVMYRATTNTTNKHASSFDHGTSSNHWADTDLTSSELADMIDTLAQQTLQSTLPTLNQGQQNATTRQSASLSNRDTQNDQSITQSSDTNRQPLAIGMEESSQTNDSGRNIHTSPQGTVSDRGQDHHGVQPTISPSSGTRTDGSNGNSTVSTDGDRNSGRGRRRVISTSENNHVHNIPEHLLGETHILGNIVDDLLAMTTDEVETSQYSRDLLHRIVGLNPNIEVTFVEDLTQTPNGISPIRLKIGGVYPPNENGKEQILIYPQGEWQSSILDLVNHELAHAVTAEAVEQGMVNDELAILEMYVKFFMGETDSVWENYSELLNDRLRYAISKNHEMIAVITAESAIRHELQERYGADFLTSFDDAVAAILTKQQELLNESNQQKRSTETSQGTSNRTEWTQDEPRYDESSVGSQDSKRDISSLAPINRSGKTKSESTTRSTGASNKVQRESDSNDQEQHLKVTAPQADPATSETSPNPILDMPQHEDMDLSQVELGEKDLKQRFKTNVEVIKILQTLKSENRQATPQERKTIATYSGWGALSGVFDPQNKKWAKEYQELKDLLSEHEYKAARASVRNAYYTPKEITESMFSMLNRMGFSSGRVLVMRNEIN